MSRKIITDQIYNINNKSAHDARQQPSLSNKNKSIDVETDDTIRGECGQIVCRLNLQLPIKALNVTPSFSRHSLRDSKPIKRGKKL